MQQTYKCFRKKQYKKEAELYLETASFFLCYPLISLQILFDSSLDCS